MLAIPRKGGGTWAVRRLAGWLFNFFLLCVFFYLPPLGPELWVKVKLDCDVLLQTPPKSFFPKNKPPEKRPTWIKLHTHRLEFQMFSCTIFLLPPPRGSSDTNWRVNPEQYTVPRRWQMGWILDCSVAVQMGNKAGITKDWFMGRVRVNLPPILYILALFCFYFFAEPMKIEGAAATGSSDLWWCSGHCYLKICIWVFCFVEWNSWTRKTQTHK